MFQSAVLIQESPKPKSTHRGFKGKTLTDEQNKNNLNRNQSLRTNSNKRYHETKALSPNSIVAKHLMTQNDILDVIALGSKKMGWQELNKTVNYACNIPETFNDDVLSIQRLKIHFCFVPLVRGKVVYS